MNWLRKNIGAALLVVAGAGAAFYVLVIDRHSLTTNEIDARKHNLFEAWRADEISRVAIKTEAHEVVLTSKAKGSGETRQWDVAIDGTTYPADEQAVAKFLGTLEYAISKREIPKGSVDRAAFGLDSPRETVEIKMGDIVMHLAIGSAATIKDEVYAEVKERGVFAITSELAAQLEPNPDDLRSKSFVPYFSTDIATISLRGEGGDRDLERATWSAARESGFVLKGDGIRVDGDVLFRMFAAFQKMQADALLDDAIADKASTSKITLTLTPKNGPRAVILLGGPCPTKKNHVIAIRKEPTRLSACVPDMVMDALSQPLAAFEDRHLIGSTIDDVIELTIKDGDKKLDLARSGSGFKMRSPVDRMVSGDRGNAFVSDMLFVKGDVAPADAPLEGTPIEVTVRSGGAGVGPNGEELERTEEISIYPPKASKDEPEIERSVVVRKEDGRRLYVSKAFLHNFAANDLLVRDLTVTKEKPDSVTEISIDGGGKKQRLVRSDKGFDLLEPKGKGIAADVGFATELAGDIAHIETTRWIAEKDDGGFGLGTPRLSIEAKLTGKDDKGAAQDKTIKVSIGARTDEGSYARIDSDPAVFLAPNALVDDASRWIVSRSAFNVSAESIDKLVVRGEGDKRIELVRDGKQLKVKGKTDHRADELSAIVARAMDDLIPIGTVSLGDPEPSQGFKKPQLSLVATTASGDVTIDVGTGDTFDRTSIYYARRSGIDATYAVPASVVSSLLDAVSGH